MDSSKVLLLYNSSYVLEMQASSTICKDFSFRVLLVHVSVELSEPFFSLGTTKIMTTIVLCNGDVVDPVRLVHELPQT